MTIHSEPPRTGVREHRGADWARSRFRTRVDLRLDDGAGIRATELTVGDIDLVRIRDVSGFRAIPRAIAPAALLFAGAADAPLSLHAGDFRLDVAATAPALIRSAVRVRRPSRGEILLVALPADQLAAVLPAVAEPPAQVFGARSTLLPPLAHFVEALFALGPAWQGTAAYFAERVLHEMGIGLLLEATAPVPAAPPHPTVFSRARQLIVARAGDVRLDPASLAAQLGTPLRTLQREFAERGVSIAREIRRARVRLARDLRTDLVWADASAAELAQAAGFSTVKTMRRALAEDPAAP